jgi:hypothetical protein
VSGWISKTSVARTPRNRDGERFDIRLGVRTDDRRGYLRMRFADCRVESLESNLTPK